MSHKAGFVDTNNSSLPPPSPSTPPTQDAEATIADRIAFALAVMPRLTSTMIQQAIGPAIPPRVWRSHLGALVNAGIVVEDFYEGPGPNGRWRRMNFYCLKMNQGKLQLHFPLPTSS